jgi:AcrR family transcriptional regulator
MDAKTVPLDRNAWVACALDTLKTEGVAGVRVERLARRLGVTKGSFYWHFKDRDALLQGMLDYWEKELTTKVRNEVRDAPGDARQRLLRLMEAIQEQDAARYETAMRAWAVFDKRAATAVKKVDEQRLAFLKALFREMGFGRRQAEIRARLFLHYEVAEPSIYLRTSKEEQPKLTTLRHKFLTER